MGSYLQKSALWSHFNLKHHFKHLILLTFINRRLRRVWEGKIPFFQTAKPNNVWRSDYATKSPAEGMRWCIWPA